MKLAYLVLFSSSLALTFTSPAPRYRDEGEVVAVAMIMMHGDRTPEEPYANDPYKDPSYWPEGWGVLTDKGKLDEFLVGQWLRGRYSKLFQSSFAPDIIHALAKNSNVCLMSLLSLLAGLFPPNRSTWGPIQWEPVPVHSIPDDDDNVLAMTASCPVFDDAYDDANQSKEVRGILKKYEDVLDYLTLKSGDEINTLSDVKDLYTILKVQEERNFTLPQWTQHVYPEPMKTLAGEAFSIHTLTNEMKSLYSGNLIERIVTDFDDKSQGVLSPNRNISIYLADDMVLASLLNTLGIYNSIPPPFGSGLLLELKNFAGEYFIRALYKNSSSDPSPLPFPKCNFPCPYSSFRDIYSDFISTDWENDCSN